MIVLYFSEVWRFQKWGGVIMLFVVIFGTGRGFETWRVILQSVIILAEAKVLSCGRVKLLFVVILVEAGVFESLTGMCAVGV